jgi:hypothetical protein
MRKALIITGTTLVLAPAVLVAGYFGVQKYIDWLIAGAKRPLPSIGPHSAGDEAARPGAAPGVTHPAG